MREAERCRRRIPKLDAERTKLLQAHLADAVPLEVLAIDLMADWGETYPAG